MDQITNLLAIMLGAILANNFIFSQFLGICPFLGVSKKVDTAVGMGIAVTFVMGLASAVCYVVNQFVLIKFGLEYMQTVTFILVIASLVQFIEMFLQKSMPSLYTALGIYLPLITTNCAVLGRAAERAGQLRLHRVRGLRHHRRPGLPAGHRALRQHPGASGVCRLSQGL